MADENFNRIVGQNIQLLRKRLDLTQDALAEYLGVSRGQVNYYEAGSRAVSTDQLQKLADLFCLNPHDFYEENAENIRLNIAFAFRANQLDSQDLKSIAHFKKIIRNYLNMKNSMRHE